MTQLPNNLTGLLNNPLLTVGINPNAQMLPPQPMGGFGVPQNPMMGMPQMMPQQQQKPTSFADRLKSLIPTFVDYYKGASQAGRASLDPSSGDANFVNSMGLQNVENQRRYRQALANQLQQQQIANQTQQQKNYLFRQSLSPTDRTQFDKYLTSASKGNLPASIQEDQYLQQIKKTFGNNSQREKDFLKLKRRGFDVKDLGSALAVIDNNGTIIQTIPKGVTPDNQPQNIIQKKEAEALGKELGNLKIQYPAIKADLRDKIQTIDRILNYKNLDSYLGAIQGKGFTPRILDSERQDFLADLEKITSQEFLAQFGKLRGGGSITEAEGKKATSASTTLRPTLSEKRFREELKRLKEVAELGVQRKYGQIKSLESGNFDIDTPSKANQELFYNPDTGELLDSEGQIVK